MTTWERERKNPKDDPPTRKRAKKAVLRVVHDPTVETGVSR